MRKIEEEACGIWNRVQLKLMVQDASAFEEVMEKTWNHQPYLAEWIMNSTTLPDRFDFEARGYSRQGLSDFLGHAQECHFLLIEMLGMNEAGAVVVTEEAAESLLTDARHREGREASLSEDELAQKRWKEYEEKHGDRIRLFDFVRGWLCESGFITCNVNGILAGMIHICNLCERAEELARMPDL